MLRKVPQNVTCQARSPLTKRQSLVGLRFSLTPSDVMVTAISCPILSNGYWSARASAMRVATASSLVEKRVRWGNLICAIVRTSGADGNGTLPLSGCGKAKGCMVVAMLHTVLHTADNNWRTIGWGQRAVVDPCRRFQESDCDSSQYASASPAWNDSESGRASSLTRKNAVGTSRLRLTIAGRGHHGHAH